MEPDQGFAVCPSCGRRDDTASLRPLFVVTGASGSGKTTLFGPLTKLLAGRCLVFDVDWLIDASAALSAAPTVADIPWDGFAQAWLAVAHGAAQSGLPTVLLGTLTPGGLEENVGRKWVGAIHGLLLDCPDEIRRQRIEARPPGVSGTSLSRSAGHSGSERRSPSRSIPPAALPTKRPKPSQLGSKVSLRTRSRSIRGAGTAGREGVRAMTPSKPQMWLFGFWRGADSSHRTTIEPSTRQFGLPA